MDKSAHLRNVVKEGMRLHPVSSAGSVRVLSKDFETSEGYILPKGALALIQYMMIFRDPKVFRYADEFIPSRWEHATKEMEESFYPFSAGKQNCVGQSLANAEMYRKVSSICSEIDLEIVDEGRGEC